MQRIFTIASTSVLAAIALMLRATPMMPIASPSLATLLNDAPSPSMVWVNQSLNWIPSPIKPEDHQCQ